MTVAPEAEALDPNAVLFELFLTPEGKADPYPRYATLLGGAPIFRSLLDAWVVTHFDDCSAVLRDSRFGKNPDGSFQRVGVDGVDLTDFEAFAEDQGRSMLFVNPPDHTRLRSLVSKAFTPRTVEALRPHIARLTDELIDGFGDGEVDVMTALAFPLPVTVIGELLGVPAADRPQFQSLVRAGTAALEVGITREVLQTANDANLAMRAYFADLIAERRRAPQDDLLSSLIAAEEAGDTLSEAEIISTAILLFAAGFETTTNLLGNGLLALLRHPDQLQRLREDPGLLRTGVDELLRWDSPVQIDGRQAFEDLELAGGQVRAGEMVITLLGAANHDPTHYTDPGNLDVGRSEGPPMSFGAGIHFCLGAALARVEGQVVLGRLLERFPAIELCGHEPEYRPSLTLRGLVDLPVSFRAA